MPSVARAGGRLPYADAGGAPGASDGDGETVLSVGEAGLGPWVLGWQHRALAGPHRSLAVPLRGARVGDADGPPTAAGGPSADGDGDAPSAPVPGPPGDIGDLIGDLAAVRRDAGVARPHLLGVGLGGIVALAYAASHPVRSLTLLGTPSGPGPVDRTEWRAALPDPGDVGAVRDSLAALLSGAFRRAQPDVVEGICEWRAAEDARPPARDALLAVLAGSDGPDATPVGPLHEVTAPALVLGGGADDLVPPEAVAALADGLPRGEHRCFPGAGHLIGVERSRPVNDAVVGFLDGRARVDHR